MNTTPAAVLDTNVVLDWLVFDDARVRALATAIRARRLRWLACNAMNDELLHVLTQGALRHRSIVSECVLTYVRDLQEQQAAPTGLALPRLRCRDASDQIFLDLALHAGARWLLTHDRALLALRRKAMTLGLAIVRPQEWSPAALTQQPPAAST